MLQLDLGEDDGQLVDEGLLLVVLPEHGRHLLLQVADDVGVDLGGDRSTEGALERALRS